MNNTQEESMKIFDLVIKENLLPTKIDELVPLSFIGTAAVEYYKSKIKLMNKLETTEEQKRATLKDGQEAGIMLLNIEAKIGQLLPSVEEMRKTAVHSEEQGKPQRKKLPDDISRKKAFKARTILNNPDVVEESIKEAIENEDIPTTTAVLNKIKYEKEKARRIKAESEGRTQKTEMELRIEEQQYINTLESIIHKLPKEPPADWSEQFFTLAKGYANIIINRLEVFNDK